MKELIARINDFLREISMHPDQTDIQFGMEACILEMKKGLDGTNSSIKMIPTYISSNGTPPNGVPTITVDAGGTNLRIALVTFSEGRPVISDMNVYPIPGSMGEISADAFFNEIAEKILPLAEVSNKIGFCFSYPAEIFPNRDGKILRLSKGVLVRGAENLVIGRELTRKLCAKGIGKDLGFTLINDTVACMMGGAAEFPVTAFDGTCGLILGTGFNTCYLEKGDQITKLAHADDMIINCETGNFSKVFRGQADEMTDLASENPGIGFCEKMISGAYLGKVITNSAILAAKRELLSAAFKTTAPAFSLPELDSFLRGADNRVSKMCIGTDCAVLKEIIDSSFERAAKIVCFVIAALCMKCDGGKTSASPFCVVAEGSTFYKSLLLRDKLDRYVKDFIEGRLSRHITFRGANHLTLTGSALSALIN